MDTSNKHIGNVISKMSDSDIKEVLEQFMKKGRFNTNEILMKYFNEVLECDDFDYEGNMNE